MKKLTVILAVFTMVSAAFATAVPEGTQEIGLSGTFTADTPEGTDSDLLLRYGRFVQDQLVVGGLFNLRDNNAASFYGFGAYSEYNWDVETPWTPYLGLALAWGAVDSKVDSADNDSFVGTPYAGVKYYFTDSVAAYSQFEYNLASDDIYVDEDLNVDSKNYGIRVGIRVYIP